MESKQIYLDRNFLLFFVVLLMVLPLPWISACILAAAVHEAGHYVSIRLIGGKGIQFGMYAFRAKMKLPTLSLKREMICALAGPTAGLMMLLLIHWMPRTAVCAFCQSVWNLLPIYPLDGGRMVNCLVKLLLPPPKARYVARLIDRIARIALMLLWFFLSLLYSWTAILFVFSIVMFAREIRTCKVSDFDIQ